MNRLKLRSFLWILLFSSVIINACPASAAEKMLYAAGGQRDPFVQLLTSGARQAPSGLLGVENVEDIRVEGIVMDANRANSVVIVNGTMMRQGEELGQVKVLSIKADGATFLVNGVEGFKALYQEN